MFASNFKFDVPKKKTNMAAPSVVSNRNYGLTVLSVFICSFLIGPRYSTCELTHKFCCLFSICFLTFRTL